LRHVDSSVIFSNGFQWVEGGSKEGRDVLTFFETDSYILKVVEDFVDDVQTTSKFPD